LLQAVEIFVDRRLDQLTVVGGGAQSGLWCQIFADVLDRPVRRVREPILANVRGAAFLAAIGLGHMTFAEVAAEVEVERTFEPQAAHRGVYDELYGAFGDLYRRNRTLFAKLNRHGNGPVGPQEADEP
jgi:xylulokinase